MQEVFLLVSNITKTCHLEDIQACFCLVVFYTSVKPLVFQLSPVSEIMFLVPRKQWSQQAIDLKHN